MIHGNGADRSQQRIWHNNTNRPHWGWSHSWEHVKQKKHWIASHSIRRNASRGNRRYNQSRRNESDANVIHHSDTQLGSSHLNTTGHKDTTEALDMSQYWQKEETKQDTYFDTIDHKYTTGTWESNLGAIVWKTYSKTDRSRQINPYAITSIRKWDPTFTETTHPTPKPTIKTEKT